MFLYRYIISIHLQGVFGMIAVMFYIQIVYNLFIVIIDTEDSIYNCNK